jgi:HEAT repeat protein
LIDLWRPLFFESITEMPQVLPVIPASDWFTLVQLYNSIQESIVGEAKNHMNVLARRIGLDRVALNLVRRGKLSHRLTAIIALGNLREKTAKGYLERILLDKSSLLSLLAAHALLRIDPQSTIVPIAVLCSSRRDWCPVRVIEMLSEAGTDTIVGPLSKVAADAPTDESIRVLGFLEATRCAAAIPVAHDILERRGLDDRMIVACLRLFAEFAISEDLPLIRGYLTHRNWCVRLHAVKALGRLGSQGDAHLLISRLDDDNWWVRFRTAEALANFSFMTKTRLTDIQARASSRGQKILAPFVTAEPLKHEVPL